MGPHDIRLRDSVNDAEFGYSRDGYGIPVPVQSDTSYGVVELIDAAQPLLWYDGHMGPRELSQLGGTDSLRTRPIAPGEVLFIGGGGRIDGVRSLRRLEQLFRYVEPKALREEQAR